MPHALYNDTVMLNKKVCFIKFIVDVRKTVFIFRISHLLSCFHGFDNGGYGRFYLKFFHIQYRSCSFRIGIIFLLLTGRNKNIIGSEDLKLVKG